IIVIILLLYFTLDSWFANGQQLQEKFLAIVNSTIKRVVVPVKMKRCDTHGMSQIEKNTWQNFQFVKDDSWNLFQPCGYTHVEKELSENDHFHHKKSGYIMGIPGADNFAAKDKSW